MRAIECENLTCCRAMWNGQGSVAVRDISMHVHRGEFVGFCGPDGSGKGLLLNLIGLLERPDSGILRLGGEDTSGFADEDAAEFRNEACGYLFGHPYLLPSFSIAENVAMPLFRIRGGDAVEARHRTLDVLRFAGIENFETLLAGRSDHAVRWRAAFARALVHAPGILIAISPPCGNELLPLARRAVRELGITILWSGPREELSPVADRLFEIRDGRLAAD